MEALKNYEQDISLLILIVKALTITLVDVSDFIDVSQSIKKKFFIFITREKDDNVKTMNQIHLYFMVVRKFDLTH